MILKVRVLHPCDYECFPMLSPEALATATHIEELEVPKPLRGKGIGTNIVKLLCALADLEGRYVVLQAYPYESEEQPHVWEGQTYAEARTRMLQWYRRMGFIGGNWMRRPPKLRQ